MKKILSTSILALAGLAFAASSADAALAYNDGDLIVAFRGASTTYLINIGSVTQFTTGGSLSDGNLHTLSIGNIGTDLGSGLNPTLWSLQASDPFGQVNPAGSFNEVWASQTETTPGVGSVAAPIAGSALVFASGGIQAVGLNGYSVGNATVNNPAGYLQANSTLASYRSFQDGGSESPLGAYNYFNSGIEGTYAVGSNSSVLDLYEFDENRDGLAPIRLGAFQVTGSGAATSIQFSSDITDFAPVPEPGTFAFGFAVIGACLAGRFRSRRQTVAELVA